MGKLFGFRTDKTPKLHSKNRFKLFWLDELPQIVLYSKKQLLISLLIFLLSASIGIFSSFKDSQFASSILGESYVTMTKENIKNGGVRRHRLFIFSIDDLLWSSALQYLLRRDLRFMYTIADADPLV